MSQLFLWFLMGIFSQSLGYRSHSLVSRFLSEGISPCVTVHLVCLWKKGNSATSDIAVRFHDICSVKI